MDIKNLFAEFPKEDVHWRAQSLTRNGDKAMALAYIDARHVMERLDHVLGAENWQDRYEVHGAKTICYLSIKIGGEWITKADGAGDTAVEKEKGSISDAFKRAAVKWGVGRYLYEMPTPWVPCETYEAQGKRKFSKFTADPWDYVKGTPTEPKRNSRETYEALVSEMQSKDSLETLEVFIKSDRAKNDYKSLPQDWKDNFNREVSIHKSTLSRQPEAAE